MAADHHSQVASSAQPHQPSQPASTAPEQGPGGRAHRRGGSFGSFDLQDLVKASSAGDFSFQDFVANTELAEAPSWIPQAVNTGTAAEGPSPLLRWTSDGSLMEELLKTFPDTPRQQGQLQPSGGSLNGAAPLSQLSKDASLGAVLAALMAQAAEEEQAHASATASGANSAQQVPQSCPASPSYETEAHAQPPASSASSQSLLSLPLEIHGQSMQTMPEQPRQHRHAQAFDHGAALPPADPTVPSSRGSLTFPILGNPGSQPGMRRLRIIPASGPATTSEAADARHTPAHAQAAPDTSFAFEAAAVPEASHHRSQSTPGLTPDEQALLQASYASAGEQVYSIGQASRHSQMHTQPIHGPSSFIYPPFTSQQPLPLPLTNKRSASYQESALDIALPSIQPRASSLPGHLPDLQQPSFPGYQQQHHQHPLQAVPVSSLKPYAAPVTSGCQLGDRYMHQPVSSSSLESMPPPGLPTARVVVSSADMHESHLLYPPSTASLSTPSLQQHGASRPASAAHALSTTSAQMDMSSHSDFSDAGPSRRPWSAPVQASEDRLELDLDALAMRHAAAAGLLDPGQPVTMDVSHIQGLRGPPKRERSMNSQRPPIAPKRTATASGAQYTAPLQQQQPPRSPYEEQEEVLRASSSEYMTASTSLPDPAGLDKKALRKEKNRASAAASRARREAYTQSLEEEVKRLQDEKQWLEEQVNPALSPDLCLPAIGTAMAIRPPLRHLSI